MSFSSDRRPSLYVNDAKQVFLCRSCGEHGDVIDFVMKIDSLTFQQAKTTLGIVTYRKPRPQLTPSRKRAAEVAAAWVTRQRQKFNTLIAEAMFHRDLADEFGEFEFAESFDRSLVMLHGFYDALEYPRGAMEMLALRRAIEALTDGAAVTL